MNIQFFDPLGRAWERMVNILFRPFDLGRWFALGFSAFLADLVNGRGGGSGARASSDSWDYHSFGEFFRFPERAWDWLMAHPFWTSLIVTGLLFLFTIIVVLTWLSSRGKFMFLDNVVHNRSKVVQPWKDFSRQGDSLFLWRLVYGLIIFILVSGLMVMVFLSFRELYFDNAPRAIWVARGIGTGLGFFFLFVVLAYIDLFLNGFVVPIMYKNRIGVLRGWGIYLKLFGRKMGYFLVFGLIMLLLVFVTIAAVATFGFLTCCIGFLFLIIPYLNSVLLLPVSVTFRSYSLEFLRQFGPEYDVFPSEQEKGTAE